MKMLSIVVVSLLFLPAGLFFEKNEGNLNNDGVKIYSDISGEHMFAQSFKPYFENLTYVNISAEIQIDPISKFLIELFEKILPDKLLPSFFLHDLVVSIRSDLYGEDLVSKNFSWDEVENCGGKLVWKLDKEYTLLRGADDPYWGEHGLDPVNEEYGSKTYYIVARADGGNPQNCYIWLFNNSEYEDGEAYEWLPATSEWSSFSENVYKKDFGFEVAGCLSWEDGDGVVKQYNIVELLGRRKVGNDYIDHEDIVIKYLRGKSFTFNTSNDAVIWGAFTTIDYLSDDDIIFLWFDGEGVYGYPIINGHSANQFEKRFERMKADGIGMIFDCCYAGDFTNPSKSAVCKPGRVIMASCAEWESESGFLDEYGDFWSGFSYYFYEGLKDKGYKTAEELFEYASQKWNREEQIYDTYPGELYIGK